VDARTEQATSRTVLEALGATGAIGATPRQLAHRTGLAVDQVGTVLAGLATDGEVLRIGRGLWVLQDFRRLEGRDDFADPASYVERFVREDGVTLGAYRGAITFRSNDEEPVHRWWPYVQGYSAEFVRSTLRTLEVGPGATVLDPFAGSGTTLVEARRAGARAVGCELLPTATLSARVKTRFELDPKELARRATTLLRRVGRARPAALPFLKETRRQFSHDALEELLRFRQVLPVGAEPVDEALRLAFGRILIPSSRLRRSPCLGYGRPEEPDAPSPTERYRAAVAEMAEDLHALGRERVRWGPPATVHEGDARSIRLAPGSVDLAVTSPPYVNGMDYVMNYKVDLAWLGYASSYADLRRLRASSVACDNLPRSETASFVGVDGSPDPWLDEILRTIRSNVRSKGGYRREDAHAVVHRYFADLVPVLGRVRDALRPGGRFVVVVGDSLLAGAYIPGDLILARMASRLGFAIDAVDVARSRRSGQRRSFELRETVVTLRRTAA
jgi:SAM-dependent methyltransferase